jgi:hypothetical protein
LYFIMLHGLLREREGGRKRGCWKNCTVNNKHFTTNLFTLEQPAAYDPRIADGRKNDCK